MHTPTTDNLTPDDREPTREHPASPPVEREVRLQGARTPEDVIRGRVESGFYLTPAMAAAIARRIVARGDV